MQQRTYNIGILAFQGDVIEHIRATQQAIANQNLEADVTEVRTKDDLRRCKALIIPGGESTVLYKLSQREDFFEDMKQVPYIFGTCAGAIMLAKTIEHKEAGQRTLELMDISVDRNAYGRQTNSFETELNTELGTVPAIFIRAPKITSVSQSVHVLARYDTTVIACEQQVSDAYYLALTFHPELSTPLFHEYFLKHIHSA